MQTSRSRRRSPANTGYDRAAKQCYAGGGYGHDAFTSSGIPADEVDRGRKAYDYLLQFS